MMSAMETETGPPVAEQQLGQRSIDEDADVDNLLDLFNTAPEGSDSPPRATDDAVEQLLMDIRPPPSVVSSKNSGVSAAVRRLPSAAGFTEEVVDFDLPEPTMLVPAEVFPIPFVMTASFNLKTELDLKKVSFGLRHAEFNPRSHPSITLRLVDTPKATALVRASGAVTISGGPGTTEDSLKRSAKKVARLIQRSGYEEQVKFADYRVTGLLCKVNLGFPVRLDKLAGAWRRNALYEPEIYCGCVFRTRNPRATYLVTHGGKVIISGLRKIEDVTEALRRAYPEFYKFQNL